MDGRDGAISWSGNSLSHDLAEESAEHVTALWYVNLGVQSKRTANSLIETRVLLHLQDIADSFQYLILIVATSSFPCPVDIDS